jgi:predicted AAA+ superfamily ATPase
MIIQRLLDLQLPPRKSAFLWGPRKTGKTTYLKQRFPESVCYDFLQTDLFLRFSKSPALLRQELLALDPKRLHHPILLDEVQKVPQLLDEVHWLIENKRLQFILCGSSARKLKRGKANLLGGRAWRFELFPLVSPEIRDFHLLRALNHGLIPVHYLEDHPRKSLEGYIQDYLKEEVFAEGLTRNIPAFSRFFDAMGYSHGELTVFSNIARDAGVDAKTVKEYYQILVDTLLGSWVLPFRKRQHRQVIAKASKFYLFDVGVAGAMTKRRLEEARGEGFGKALEHFILMELMAYRAYRSLDFEIRFWRTKSGLEVDFILGEAEIALEVKGASRVDAKELRPLTAFREEHAPKHALVVCLENTERVVGKIRILPWNLFLEKLWAGHWIR